MLIQPPAAADDELKDEAMAILPPAEEFTILHMSEPLVVAVDEAFVEVVADANEQEAPSEELEVDGAINKSILLTDDAEPAAEVLQM